jgi:hypothetical protein
LYSSVKYQEKKTLFNHTKTISITKARISSAKQLAHLNLTIPIQTTKSSIINNPNQMQADKLALEISRRTRILTLLIVLSSLI